MYLAALKVVLEVIWKRCYCCFSFFIVFKNTVESNVYDFGTFFFSFREDKRIRTLVMNVAFTLWFVLQYKNSHLGSVYSSYLSFNMCIYKFNWIHNYKSMTASLQNFVPVGSGSICHRFVDNNRSRWKVNCCCCSLIYPTEVKKVKHSSCASSRPGWFKKKKKSELHRRQREKL